MKRYVFLAAAALLAAPSVASAGVTGQVTLNNVSYTLTDLDPNDGVTPSITFLPTSQSGAIVLQYSPGNASHTPGGDGSSDGYQAPGMSVGGSFSGLGSLTSASLTAFAGADQAVGQRVTAWASTNSGWFDFVLSPHTALSISADVQFSGQVTAGGDANRLDMDGDIWLTGEGDSSGVSRQFSTDSGTLRNPTAPFDWMASVLGTYANDSAASFPGSLLLYTTVDALSVPSAVTAPPPVPEPANIAMLAAGLPLLLALCRRTGAPATMPARDSG